MNVDKAADADCTAPLRGRVTAGPASLEDPETATRREKTGNRQTKEASRKKMDGRKRAV